MNEGAQDLVIVKLDRAKQALAEAKTIQQTKTILDVADAMEIYAKRQQLGDDAIGYAHAIKIEALRQLGGLLKDTPKNHGTRLAGRAIGGSAKELPKDPTPTLADLGINKKTSMVAQQLAGLPQALFEQVRDGLVTLTKALQEVRPATTNTVAWSPDAFKDLLRPLSNRQTGSNQNIAAALRDLADEVEEVDDPDRRDAVSIARDELDLHDAEPGGYRIFETEEEAATHPGSPAVIGSCKSTYPDWYKALTTAPKGVTALRRQQVEARLADIEAGKLPTKRTERTHCAVLSEIKNLPWTSSLSRGRM